MWDQAVEAPLTSYKGLLEKRRNGRRIGNNSFDHIIGEKLRREKPRSVGG
jgi:hypothetical protein